MGGVPKYIYAEKMKNSYADKYLESGKLSDRLLALSYKEKYNTIKEILDLLK